MIIPDKTYFKDDNKYRVEVDKYFFITYGFKEWATTTIENKIKKVEKLIPPVCNYYEEDGDRCLTFNRYERGGLR
tara:strand:+ start:1545 stop:1769 length:225 start_codon:yes stop_codon:yes gene_type:complete